MFHEPIHPQVARELSQAQKQIRLAALQDKRLPLLFLIDPTRAFADGGVKLSPAARKYLRRAYPASFHRDKTLYDDVRNGTRAVPWVKRAVFRPEKGE